MEMQHAKKNKNVSHHEPELSLGRIYPDALTAIAEFLDFLALLAMRITSRQFRDFCTNVISQLTNVVVNRENLIAVATYCKNLIGWDMRSRRADQLMQTVFLNNKNISEYDGPALESLKALKQITTLKIMYPGTLEDVLDILRVHGKGIKTFSVYIKNAAIQNIPLLCPNLTNLSLTFLAHRSYNPDAVEIIKNLPELKTLSVVTPYANLPKFPRSPNVTALSGNWRFENAARCFPNLTSLEVTGPSCSPEGLLQLGKNCQKLKSVNLILLRENIHLRPLCQFLTDCSGLQTLTLFLARGHLGDSSNSTFGDVFQLLRKNGVVLENLTSMLMRRPNDLLVVGESLRHVAPNLEKMSGIYPVGNLPELRELTFILNPEVKALAAVQEDFPVENICQPDMFPKLTYLKVEVHDPDMPPVFSSEQVALLRSTRPNCIMVLD